jgi:hypothetical protein
MSTSSTDAAEALAAMRASQARLAVAAVCPPGRHLAFGAVMGCLAATPALSTTNALVAEAVLVACIALIVRWDRRRTGMFINGYRAGKTRPITFTMLGVFLVLYLASFWLARDRGIYWAPIPIGVLTAGLAYYASTLWQRAFRRELGLAA